MVEAVTSLTKSAPDLFAIKPLSLGSVDEELQPFGVGASIGHAKETRAGVLPL